MKQKTIIFLGDGMSDEPIAELDGKTPLQFAHTPAMDSIAKEGASGTLLTLPQGFPTSSEVANMSVLGCNLEVEYCGRGPIEAAGLNIRLNPDDKAFRLNLVSQKDGILKDYSGGHVSQEHAVRIIDALNKNFGSETVKFYPGVSYRNILVLSGNNFSSNLKTEKPDDNHEEYIADHLPVALSQDALETAEFLKMLIAKAPGVLASSDLNREMKEADKAPVNGVWPWSGGSAGALKKLKEKYDISSAVISAVAVIRGLGRCLGMNIIDVPGATGYIDTNYEGKAEAAIEALKKYDLVYMHLEATDEVSHEQDLKNKLRAIENLDSRIIAPVLKKYGNSINAAVLPDHAVPVALGKHTRTPVPVSVRMKNLKPDSVTAYNEEDCPSGSLGAMKGSDLMDLLFGK